MFLVGLAIIHKEGKVLIGERKEKDEHVENLTWVFPGGEFKELDIEKEIIKTVKEETNLIVKVNKVVAARRFDEAKKDIILIYFDCDVVGGKEKPGGDLKELKWVPATSVTKYFTTSVSKEVMDFLKEIEKS